MLTTCGPGSDQGEQRMAGQYSNPPRFSELNEQVFQPICFRCHSSGAPNFSSYNTLLASGKVIPFSAENSSVYQQVESGNMPKDSAPLAQGDIQAIFEWIQNGARND